MLRDKINKKTQEKGSKTKQIAIKWMMTRFDIKK